MALSLGIALVVSVAVGAVWAALDDARNDDTVVISGSDTSSGVPLDAVQPPTIGTNAALGGTPLPGATVTDLDGNPVDTRDLVGTPLVINVWGSTCGPCKRELPDFAAVHAQYGDRVRFVGLSYLPASQREEQFARDLGVGYELLYDGNGEFIVAAGISAFPVTLFVDADGSIVTQTGALDADQLVQHLEDDLL